MAEVIVNDVSSPLLSILQAEDLQPGMDASYELCKLLYAYHPLGKKMVDFPVDMAMYKPRTLTIPAAGLTEDKLRERFEKVWRDYKMNEVIKSWKGQSRMYGATACVWGLRGVAPDTFIDKFDIPDGEIYFNVFDPLITAGSMVTNQDPLSPDFLKVGHVSASGTAWARARSAVIQNERPLFIQYTNSAFGYVGRSVYQRALFPLKTFIQSMFTDDFVTIKAGVIVLKVQQPGSIADNLLGMFNMQKRVTFKVATTGNVINIGQEDDAQTLNLQNTADAMTTARKNVIENIASAADMPAIILNAETFAAGFGEGTEDARVVQRYIDGIRNELGDCYQFLDPLVMHMAWSKGFFETLWEEFPDLKGVPYQTWFQRMKDAFAYEWPQLLEEPESELAKQDKVRSEAVIATLEVLLPQADPENKAELVRWASANFNEFGRLFPEKLNIDPDAMAEYVPPSPPGIPDAPGPFSGSV